MEGVAETIGVESFEWQGRRYEMRRLSFWNQAAYRKFLEAQDYKGLSVVHQKTLNPADYQEQLSAWRRDRTAGIWAWGTRDCFRAMGDRENFIEFVRLSLIESPGQAGLDYETVDQMLKDKDAEAEELARHLTPGSPAPPNEIVEIAQRLLAPTPTTGSPPPTGATVNP